MLYPKNILLILVCKLVAQIRNPENISNLAKEYM